MAAFEFLVKVGDCNTKDRAYKQGMLHRCKPAGYKWGTGTRKRFSIIRIDNIKNLEEAKKLCVTPSKYFGTRDETKYLSTKFIDFADLEKQITSTKLLNITDRDTDSGIIDVSGSLLKPIENYDFTRTFVKGSESEGSFNVDAVGGGGAYEYLSDAIADLAANLTGDLTFTVTANHTDDATCQLGLSLGGHTLLITATGHSGYPGSAIKITADAGSSNYFYDYAEGAGNLIIENLYLIGESAYDPQNALIYANYIDNTHTFTIRNNFLKGFAGDYTQQRGLYLLDATASYVIHNNFIWNCDNYAIETTAPVTLENNTIFGNDSGINLGNTASTAENNAVFDNGTDWLNVGSATGNNNASSDTTGENSDFSSGSNNQSSLDSADNFASETDTDTDFLFVKDNTADIYDTGKTGTYSTTDIVGTSRPSGTNWDVGAHELIVAGGETLLPIYSNQNKRITHTNLRR